MSENKTQSRDPGIELRGPPQEQQSGLPAVIEPAPLRPQWRRRPRGVFLALLLLIGAGAGIGWFWWQHHQLQLPPGIAWSNGRLEADEIDIDTKFAGRIAKLFVDEGDMVKAGQVVAMMDTRDLAGVAEEVRRRWCSRRSARSTRPRPISCSSRPRSSSPSRNSTAPAPSCPRVSPPSNCSISGVSR